MRLRCPRCGKAKLIRGWFKMVDRCPSCGLVTDRGESGYVVGSYLFNIMASELIFVAIAGYIVALTWPTPPWRLITWGGPVLMLGLPVLFYPVCRVLFLGFDLYFNPDSA
jgi:uncharacterized protein (DUF983 family)